MTKNKFSDMPVLARDFLLYLEVVRGESRITSVDYYFDLRTFFRFMKQYKGLADASLSLEQVDISDLDVDFMRDITLSDIYEFLFFLQEVRKNNARSRTRRISCLRSFFKYLTGKRNLLDKNPIEELDSPTLPKTLPKYLTLEDSISLLQNVDGPNRVRDFAILTVFLNCGLRLSELVSLNVSDISNDYIKITGKGNKQRSIYLNDACKEALDAYIQIRPKDGLKDRDALFISRNRNRISPKTVQWLVKKHLQTAGLQDQKLSVHKLRHTAATLMHKHGNVDVRVLQEILGHENLSTTQIYTHIDSEQIKQAALSNPLSKIGTDKK